MSIFNYNIRYNKESTHFSNASAHFEQSWRCAANSAKSLKHATVNFGKAATHGAAIAAALYCGYHAYLTISQDLDHISPNDTSSNEDLASTEIWNNIKAFVENKATSMGEYIWETSAETGTYLWETAAGTLQKYNVFSTSGDLFNSNVCSLQKPMKMLQDVFREDVCFISEHLFDPSMSYLSKTPIELLENVSTMLDDPNIVAATKKAAANSEEIIQQLHNVTAIHSAEEIIQQLQDKIMNSGTGAINSGINVINSGIDAIESNPTQLMLAVQAVAVAAVESTSGVVSNLINSSCNTVSGAAKIGHQGIYALGHALAGLVEGLRAVELDYSSSDQYLSDFMQDPLMGDSDLTTEASDFASAGT